MLLDYYHYEIESVGDGHQSGRVEYRNINNKV